MAYPAYHAAAGPTGWYQALKDYIDTGDAGVSNFLVEHNSDGTHDFPGTPTGSKFLRDDRTWALPPTSTLGWINVLDPSYGAVGNGTTDDTAAIQTALNAVPAAGGVVYLPPGYSYKTTAALTTARDNTWLIGGGPSSVIERMFNGGTGTIVINHKRCTFANFTIDGNRATYTGIGVQGVPVGVGSADYTTISGLIIKDCSYHGVNLAGVSYSIVEGCEAANCGGVSWPSIFTTGATSNNGRYNKIRGNTVNSTQDAIGIQVYSDVAATDTSYTHVIGNTVYSGKFCIAVEPTGSGVRQVGCVVADNVCVSASGTGGTIGGGLTILGNYTAITGNSYDVNGQTAATACLEITDCFGTVATGNTLVGTGGADKGISVQDSSQCAVTGNIVHGWGASGTANGIMVFGYNGSACDNTVTGNTVIATAGTSTKAIVVRAYNSGSAHADRNVISGNVLRGTNEASTVGIYLFMSTGTVDGNVVTGNSISNFATLFQKSGDTNSRVRANGPLGIARTAITPGASPYTYQNLDAYPELVSVFGGTVSAVAYSRDNSTFDTITAATGVLYYVGPGDYLKVTYSSVPTMTKFPLP